MGELNRRSGVALIGGGLLLFTGRVVACAVGFVAGSDEDSTFREGQFPLFNKSASQPFSSIKTTPLKHQNDNQTPSHPPYRTPQPRTPPLRASRAHHETRHGPPRDENGRIRACFHRRRGDPSPHLADAERAHPAGLWGLGGVHEAGRSCWLADPRVVFGEEGDAESSSSVSKKRPQRLITDKAKYGFRVEPEFWGKGLRRRVLERWSGMPFGIWNWWR